MNGRTAKLIRKVATLSGKKDSYVKNEYKKMSSEMKQDYLAFVKTVLIQTPGKEDK